MKTKPIGAIVLASGPARTAHRLAGFTPGDYASRERAAARANPLPRADVRAELARARAAHEISIDLHG